MKFNKIKINPLLGKGDDTIKTVAIISGVAVGIAIGALFATESGKTLRKN